MSYLSAAFQLALNRRAVNALRHFDQDLVKSDRRMVEACQCFFRRLKYTYRVHRKWLAPSAGILFVSDHGSALDGFAMALASPDLRPVRRVIFAGTAHALGRTVAQESIRVWPRMNYHNLLHDTNGFLDRLTYMATHSWNPWIPQHRPVEAILRALAQGERVTLLPSGTVGRMNWRSGIGDVLLQGSHAMDEAPDDLRPETYLAPVYLNWKLQKCHVEIDAPCLLPFSQLIKHAPAGCDRVALTAWLRERYQTRDWLAPVLSGPLES